MRKTQYFLFPDGYVIWNWHELYLYGIVSRVSDPAFFLIADPDPGFDDLKLKKNYSWKFNFYFLDQKLPFNYP